jgi:hypothetical protein
MCINSWFAAAIRKPDLAELGGAVARKDAKHSGSELKRN